jgi:type II secretory pathway pseudopilin PulG
MTSLRPTQPATGHQADRGSGLVEVLVAIVLLGLGATGTLTALAAAIRGSAEESRLTGARAWLVSAADYVVSDGVPRVACTGGESAVRSAYQTAVQNVTNGRPADWQASQVTIVPPVLFWNGSGFGSTCWEANGLKLQEFTIKVVSSTTKETEIITVVKRDG